MFGALWVFGCHIKGMIRLWTGLATWHVTTVRSSRLLYIHDASGSSNKLGTPWCNAQSILLRHEARDESSDRYSVSCQSLATLRCDVMIWYDMIWYDMIWYDMIWYIFSRSWVDTRWKQYITHLHTNNTQNTEKGKFGKCRPCLVFASYTLAFALQLRKKHGNTSVRARGNVTSVYPP
jgi:hypothetical protein